MNHIPEQALDVCESSYKLNWMGWVGRGTGRQECNGQEDIGDDVRTKFKTLLYDRIFLGRQNIQLTETGNP